MVSTHMSRSGARSTRQGLVRGRSRTGTTFRRSTRQGLLRGARAQGRHSVGPAPRFARVLRRGPTARSEATSRAG